MALLWTFYTLGATACLAGFKKNIIGCKYGHFYTTTHPSGKNWHREIVIWKIIGSSPGRGFGGFNRKIEKAEIISGVPVVALGWLGSFGLL